MDLADKELVAEFVVESQEGLANIEQQMLAIETAGADVDTDLVNAVFRTMHSIKGASGFFGLDRIGTLAHSLEEILNNLRNREMVPTSELVTTMLRAADYMKGLLDAVETSNEADVAPYVAQLQKYLNRERAAEGAAKSAEPLQETLAVATETPAETTSAPLSEALREFLVECYDNLDQMERDLLTLEQNPTAEEQLRSVFRTIHTIKGGAGFLGLSALEQLTHVAEDLLGKLRSGERKLTTGISTVLLATVDKCREGLQLVEKSGTTEGFDPQSLVEQILAADQSAEKPAVAPVRAASTQAAVPTIAKTASPPPAEAQADKSQTPAGDSTIRVDVALLDKLMTRVGELVLARNQLLQYVNGLDDSNFVSTAQHLNLITTELQEGVMKTRMQPIGNVWAKFPRVVRDLSGMLNKKVRIEMEGKETELDKTIVEAIKDPLTHLVRNSVDHGIESPEKRREAGKPEEGVLLLRAYHEGGQVNIEITDDGAGLNLERIRQKAIERGLVTVEAAARMSEREAAQLILLPGFSTADQVTAVSGRGVGMDVVKTNIERISGTMDVQSKPGKGTTVKIKIPLTLAIVPALIVSCDGERYAIPQVSLLELVRLEGEQARKRIEQFQGAPVYRLRGQLLPLVYLSQVLGSNTGDKRTCSMDGRDLTADSLNLDFQVAREKHLAWKTRLRHFLNGGDKLTYEEAVSPQTCALGKWLYGEGLQEYGHIATVQKLEKLHADMHSAVGHVIQSKQQDKVNEAEAGMLKVETTSRQVVDLLNDLEHSVKHTKAVNIVVLRAEDRQFGLVVDSINDTEEIVVKPLSKQFKGISAYAGATIMGDGKVALILDVLGTAQKAHVVTAQRDHALAEHTEHHAQQSAESETMLVLAIGDRQVAMPISLVARLEEVPRENIEISDNCEVVQYRGEIMPLVRLGQILDIQTKEDPKEPLQVVVYKEGKHTLGFVVDKVTDITDVQVTAAHECQSAELLASTVIHDRVTDLLNLPSIIERFDWQRADEFDAEKQLAV